MTYGLQIFNEARSLIFDSSVAAGGVFLGIYTIPPEGAVFTFKSMRNFRQGFALNLYGGTGASGMIYDMALGYPRFTFSNLNWERDVALLVK